jgi:hypothetical protein
MFTEPCGCSDYEINAGKFVCLPSDLKIKLFIIRFKEEVAIKVLCIDRSSTW